MRMLMAFEGTASGRLPLAAAQKDTRVFGAATALLAIGQMDKSWTAIGAAMIVVGVVSILLNGRFARGSIALQSKVGIQIYSSTALARVALIVIGVAWIAEGIHLVGKYG